MAEKRTILVCSCEDTMPLDADAISRGCRGAQVKTANQLCRAEIERFRAAASRRRADHRRLHAGGAAVLRSRGRARGAMSFVNVRETAGWSDAAKAGPKMAALLAVAAEPLPEIPFVSLESEGVALIYGRDERAIEAGKLLADHLDVTVLIARSKGLTPPRVTDFPGGAGHHQIGQGPSRRLRGRGRRLCGAGAVLARRACIRRAARRRGVALRSIVLDLSGGAPLFSRRRSARRLSARRSGRSRPPCCAPCSRRAISPAPSTSRATSPSPRTCARIRAPGSSAATAVSISVRPARSRRTAITSRSMRKSAPAAASAPPPARPAPRPTRCRRPMR